MPALLVVCLLILASLLAPEPAGAAAPDGNVEWDGISHIWWLDRDPLCPVDGQSFTIRFQTYHDDLTGARVRVDDGSVAWVVASPTAVRGPYDVWSAQIPATASASLSYYLEFTDGGDTDYLSAGGMTSEPPADGGFALDFSTLAHAPVGATPLPGGGTVFKVWSPTRTTAHVRGEFNGWSTADPLAKVGEYFIGRVAAAAPGQMYKYYFQNAHWNSDARARSLNPADNYNARIIDPQAHVWQMDDFTVPPFAEMIIYQLHVGTFAGRNDPYGPTSFPSGFADVAARADHLAELGINVVMLNPITEFPGDYSAGYNPVSQWAPEWKYGTPDDLKLMVDTLHEHGIAVILDIVWNHFSTTDNYLWYYDGTQIYFDDPAVGTPWGDQADLDREAVRDYFADSALYWLEEMHLDGFRMDATAYLNIYPQEAVGWSLMQRLNEEMDGRCRDKIAIAEQLPDNAWVTRPVSLGGAGFDAQYHDAFTDNLRQETLDAALGDPEMWKIRNIITGSGQYLNGVQVVNYLELHDEAWPESGGQRIVKTIDTTYPHDDEYAKGRVKLAQGLVMTAPGIPAILQGTEWLEDSDFGTGAANRIDWSKKTTHADIFAYFQDLIALRRLSPALRADAGVDVFHLNEGGNVLAFQRYDQQGHVHVVVASFGNADRPSYRIGLPLDGAWRESLNSQASEYGGDGLTNPGDIIADAVPADGFAWSAEIALPRMGLIVLTPAGATAVEGGSAIPGGPPRPLRLLSTCPNPFNPRLTIAFELTQPSAVRATIHDLTGRRVRTLLAGSRPAGRQQVIWDGTDEAGRPLASGTYVLRLKARGASLTAKVSLVR
jgi:1,4-alpha-glucan branching enzyme